MVLEPWLIKSSKMKKRHGELKKYRRRTKESVLTKFIVNLVSESNISEGLENICGFNFASGERHLDAGESRVKIDAKKVSKWCFCAVNPFTSVQAIISIATVVTGKGEKINCYDAQNIGAIRMKKIWWHFP
ncbi:hypothetical protein AVEN_253063-1 [Araneus ventricosus]|uniref:Uncharacterized protein n=1 Tax=Araneus ventricosus TaxID=182803 RepID=A0A4Y2MHV1_ARAVE|nr:hypothetical protein AVEN_253063-1 [Araneus ventricosus]